MKTQTEIISSLVEALKMHHTHLYKASSENPTGNLKEAMALHESISIRQRSSGALADGEEYLESLVPKPEPAKEAETVSEADSNA